MSIRLVVADDQATVRESLAIMLGLTEDIEVVGVAADGGQAVELARAGDVDVVLMDLHMPVCDGVAATARIVAAHPGTRVVVLTTYADDASVLAALRAGALGYLTKDAGREQITQAVRAAAAGQAVLDPEVQRALLAAATSTAAATGPEPAAVLPDGLTPREGEVLAMIASGMSNREIAKALVVSEATVKTHINNLFAKTGARDRAQAVRYAYQHRLAR